MKAMIYLIVVLLSLTNIATADPVVVNGPDDLPDPVEGIITLDNHNEGEDWIINTSLVFGDGEIDANLKIDPNTEIWFNLDVTDYGDEETPAEIDDIYTITINPGANLICGDDGDPVIIRPNEEYTTWENPHYIWFGYPKTGENNPNEVWAGGFIINTSGNTIDNTHIDHMVGSHCTVGINGENDECWWTANGDDCFAIRLNAENASLYLEDDTRMENSFFNGVVINANSDTLKLNNSIIRNTRNPEPWHEDLEEEGAQNKRGAGHGINTTTEANNCTINGGITLIEFNEGNGVKLRGGSNYLKFDDCDILQNSGEGIYVDGIGSHTLDIDNGSQINQNTLCGINIAGTGNNNGNTVKIGDQTGNCHIDSNLEEGIKIRRSSNNSITIKNSSTVSDNVSHGIQVLSGANDIHQDSYVTDNIIIVANNSQINGNGDPEGEDEDSNGIYLEKTEETTIFISNDCEVNGNTLSGIKGVDTWWATVTG